MFIQKKLSTFALDLATMFRIERNTLNTSGEMVEWSITTVLKTVVLRGTGGSNPSLSAKNVKWEPYWFPFFCVITRVLGGQKGIGELCSKMINSKKS